MLQKYKHKNPNTGAPYKAISPETAIWTGCLVGCSCGFIATCACKQFHGMVSPERAFTIAVSAALMLPVVFKSNLNVDAFVA